LQSEFQTDLVEALLRRLTSKRVCNPVQLECEINERQDAIGFDLGDHIVLCLTRPYRGALGLEALSNRRTRVALFAREQDLPKPIKPRDNVLR
jgi:hypothetical protein